MVILNSIISLREKSREERRNNLKQKLIVKDLPYVYGLMAMAISSGLIGVSVLQQVSEYVPESVKNEIQKSVAQIDAGMSFAEALTSWSENVHLRPLAHLLVESQESGVSALATLDLMSRDAANKVRRNTETSLKQLPVTMLFPLVLCILPAFILLSVLPTLISGLSVIDW